MIKSLKYISFSNSKGDFMRKVFHSCYEMDERCYNKYMLSEEILMEHAAIGIAQYLEDNHGDKRSIFIVAGPGNNGADGMALARLLQFHLEDIKLYMPFGAKSTMAQLQQKRASSLGYIDIVDELFEADIIVDALFGAGLNRSLDKQTQKLINAMNALNGIKIACDIPSGVDLNGKVADVAFCADATITMGTLKELLFYDYIKDLAGEIRCIDLGVRYDHYTKGMLVSSYLLEQEDLNLPSRDFAMDTHKGSFGHVAILCGKHEGAGVTSGMAATRFGAGLVTLVSQNPISSPEYLMHAHDIPNKSTALAVGMGLGGYFDNEFLQKGIVESHLPVVLDADSFYIPELLLIIEQKDREIVLTPHPKEFVSLYKIVFSKDITVSEVQQNRFELAREFSEAYPRVTLLLKGANTLIVQDKKVYINALGDSRLSKGGSGDVLSGLIAALLAQGYIGIDATIQASLAFTTASNNYKGASYAMLSKDIIDQISTLEGLKI